MKKYIKLRNNTSTINQIINSNIQMIDYLINYWKQKPKFKKKKIITNSRIENMRTSFYEHEKKRIITFINMQNILEGMFCRRLRNISCFSCKLQIYILYIYIYVFFFYIIFSFLFLFLSDLKMRMKK